MKSPLRAIEVPVLSSKCLIMKSENWSFASLLIAAKLQFWDTRTIATWELVTFCLDEIKGTGLAWCFWCVVIVNLRNLQVWRSKKGTLLIFGSTIKDAKKKRFLSVEISIIHHIIMSWSQFLVQLGIVWHVCPFFGCFTFALILMVSKDVDCAEWALIMCIKEG